MQEDHFSYKNYYQQGTCIIWSLAVSDLSNVLLVQPFYFGLRVKWLQSDNRPFLYYFEANAGSLFKCKWHKPFFNDISPHEPRLHPSASPLPRIQKWSLHLKFYSPPFAVSLAYSFLPASKHFVWLFQIASDASRALPSWRVVRKSFMMWPR